MPRPFWCALQPRVRYKQQFCGTSQLPDPLPDQSQSSSTLCSSLPRSKPCRNINGSSCPKNTRCLGLALGTIRWFCTAADHCCLLVMPPLQTSHSTPSPASHALCCPMNPFHPAPHLSATSFYKPQGSLSIFRSTSSTLSGSSAPTSLSHFPALHFPYFSNSFRASRIYIGQNLSVSLATFGIKLYS